MAPAAATVTELVLPTTKRSTREVIQGGDCTAATKKKAESRALQPIILEAILRPSLTREQQVLALRQASIHPRVHVHLRSAGFILVDDALLYHVLKNVKTVLHLATQTTHKFGRPTDDMRSLASPDYHPCNSTLTNCTKKVSSRQVASLLDLSLTTYLRGVKAVKANTAALEGIHTPPKSVYFCLFFTVNQLLSLLSFLTTV